MAAYAKKTCSCCGIRLPQPEMLQREVTPRSVRGTPLPARIKWFCVRCAPPSHLDIARTADQGERARQNALVHQQKKKLWQGEQESRRLANLAKATKGEKSVMAIDQLDLGKRVLGTTVLEPHQPIKPNLIYELRAREPLPAFVPQKRSLASALKRLRDRIVAIFR